MSEKTFNLTWNNHLTNLSGLFEGLYKSGCLTDATLACQGGMLRAHRLVLAACSPYFERVFKEHYGEQPIIILKGVVVEEMECLLDFMYRGSIDVAEEHLPSLIKTATELEIRGLSGDQRNQDSQSYSRVETRMRPPPLRIDGRDYSKGSVVPADTSYFVKETASFNPDNIKIEEIEVEDDPMVIDGHEDHFDDDDDDDDGDGDDGDGDDGDGDDDSLVTAGLTVASEDQIRRIPPPMFKRETRFKGQKRVAVGRITRNNDSLEYKAKEREYHGRDLYRDDSHRSMNSSSLVRSCKMDSTFGLGNDPMVPAVQLKDDSQDREIAVLDGCSKDSPRAVEETRRKTKADAKKSDGKNGGTSTTGTSHGTEKQLFKPFSCDLCTLAFTRASHLARHRRVHTGERPFACSVCPRMFARQDKLKQHMDSHSQWPRQKKGHVATTTGATRSLPTVKGRRGRPRKISLEQSEMEEIMKFGEFSSMLNKSQPSNTPVCKIEGNRLNDEQRVEAIDDINKGSQYKSKGSGGGYISQTENGQGVDG